MFSAFSSLANPHSKPEAKSRMVSQCWQLQPGAFFTIVLVSSLFAAVSGPALSVDNNSVLSSIYACSAITDDKQRLACFDQEVKTVQAAEAKGSIVAVDNAQVQTLQREAFGFNIPSLPKIRIPTLVRLKVARDAQAKGDVKPTESASTQALVSKESSFNEQVLEKNKEGEVTKVLFPIAKYKQRASGKFVFYLENGQVWAQTNPQEVRLPRNPQGLKAEIKRAAMGTYLLRINGKGRAIRVQRRQ